jgi:APA family basic amino acid/polyamine antiporter
MYEICNRQNIDPHSVMPFIQLPFGLEIPVAANIPAIFIVLVLTILLIKGIKESTKVATIMVGVNLFIILSFIIVGAFYVQPENWAPFAPNGVEGIFTGAFVIFFAYVGFDAISTAAEETKNPQRDLPIAILGTLILCTVLYVCAALVLTGIVPLHFIDTQAPLAHAMRFVGIHWYAGLISVGALCALTTVLLIYQLGTTRILFAMSRDNFLPKSFNAIHKKFKTPHIMTWISGLIVIICGLFMDLNISAELCNFGTFTSFIIICIAVLILRKTEPDRERPFKVPFCPWFPLAGILCCGGLMAFMMITAKGNSAKLSTELFFAWIIMGALIYATYGYRKNRLAEKKEIAENE